MPVVVLGLALGEEQRPFARLLPKRIVTDVRATFFGLPAARRRW